MKKKIKCLLLTSLVLGFLQLESSAMDYEKQEDNNNNTTIIRKQQSEENTDIAILSRRVNELQEKINPSKPLRAKLAHSDVGWRPYTKAEWAPVTFDIFEGDDRLRGDQTTIKIPETGVYSLYARYCWRANTGDTSTYTAIAINSPTNLAGDWAQPHLAKNYQAHAGLNRVTHLNKGDKVMVSVYGHPTASYYLANFQLEVEKIH